MAAPFGPTRAERTGPCRVVPCGLRTGPVGLAKEDKAIIASIIKDIPRAVSADTAWALLRDAGAVHRAFPGVLVDCVREGDVRVVTFANGLAARERILTRLRGFAGF